jgi:hypothetical protein
MMHDIIPPHAFFSCKPLLPYNATDDLINKSVKTLNYNDDLKTIAQIWINGLPSAKSSIGSIKFAQLMRCGYSLRSTASNARTYINILKKYFEDPDICKSLNDSNIIVYRAMPKQYINSDANFITTTIDVNIAYHYYNFLNKNSDYVIIAIYLPPNTPILYIGGPHKEVLLKPGTFIKRQNTFKHTFIKNNDTLKFTMGIEDCYAGCNYDEILLNACKKSFKRQKISYVNSRDLTMPIQKLEGQEILIIDSYDYSSSGLLSSSRKATHSS